MILSLNEIEITVLKAARGAGMEWGLAEEVAQAARWLARQRVGFEAACLSALEAAAWRTDIAVDGACLRPNASEAWLCPIRAGASMSDLAPTPPLRIERVLHPLLLLPFAARLARPVALIWTDVALFLRGGTLAARPGDLSSAFGERADVVELTPLGVAVSTDGVDMPLGDGVEIDPDVWSKLGALAARTYVPASRRSRLSGAGAATDDNE